MLLIILYILSFLLILANCIDGSTLLELTNDIAEFSTVLPKSGHRLRLKKAIQDAKPPAKPLEQTSELPEQLQIEEFNQVINKLRVKLFILN